VPRAPDWWETMVSYLVVVARRVALPQQIGMSVVPASRRWELTWLCLVALVAGVGSW